MTTPLISISVPAFGCCRSRPCRSPVGWMIAAGDEPPGARRRPPGERQSRCSTSDAGRRTARRARQQRNDAERARLDAQRARRSNVRRRAGARECATLRWNARRSAGASRGTATRRPAIADGCAARTRERKRPDARAAATRRAGRAAGGIEGSRGPRRGVAADQARVKPHDHRAQALAALAAATRCRSSAARSNSLSSSSSSSEIHCAARSHAVFSANGAHHPHSRRCRGRFVRPRPRISRRRGRRGARASSAALIGQRSTGKWQAASWSPSNCAQRAASRRRSGPRCEARAAGVEDAGRRRVDRRGDVAAEDDALAGARRSSPAGAPPRAAPPCRGGAGARRAAPSRPISTTRPRYMTAIRSETWRMTERSCEMKT